MQNKQFSKDVGSYVSFALRMEPDLSKSGYFVDNHGNISDVLVDLKPEDPNKLSDAEFASIKALMDKYQLLQKYLPGASTLDNLQEVSDENTLPATDPQSGIEYRAVAVNRNQLEMAKIVAKKAESIHASFSKGDHYSARQDYDSLQNYLQQTRLALISEYQSVEELDESLGMHAVGTNGNPQALKNPVIFIIIEIYLT